MKKNKIIWPTPKPIMVNNLLNTGVDLLKEKIGALSQDSTNPLSRVCVANSCFSLEPVRGCPLRCAYCVAGNDCRNLLITKKDYKKDIEKVKDEIIPRRPEVLFSGDVLAKALVHHPGFIKDKSIISIAIGSSEAFLPGVEQETWSAMKYLIDNGYKNPYWFVVKYGISDNLLPIWKKRFARVLKKGSKVVISVTETNAPAWLEPYRENRFRNLRELKKIGVHITHHLRPVIRGITDSKENISKALDKSLGLSECICTGGLRIDPGIVLLWKHINKLDPKLLPKFNETKKGEMPKKDMPEKVWQDVRLLTDKKGYKATPVFMRSSYMLSYTLGIPDVNLYTYRTNDDNVFLKVPVSVQKKVENKFGCSFEGLLEKASRRIELPDIKFRIQDNKIFIDKSLNYQEHRLLIHTISHLNLLPQNIIRK